MKSPRERRGVVDMIDFSGKTAIVTGAGRGIGGAIAVTLADLGASVALVDVDVDAVTNTSANIDGTGATAAGFAGDILDVDFFAGVVDNVIERWGTLDILVNNAGVIRDNFIENIDEEDWDTVLGVNLKGAFLCARAVVPHMKEREYGKIVNIVSRAWLGNPGQSNYSASKGGLVSLTRTLALELARFQINVNAVAPGLIDTPMTQSLPDHVRERLIKAQPTRRMGSADDIAAAVCFLASDRSRFITGQVLHVDGGKSTGLLSL
jgi:NAD(P)-dependent dehydrogenase (short-subunit alcohol dehydrogenase family)